MLDLSYSAERFGGEEGTLQSEAHHGWPARRNCSRHLPAASEPWCLLETPRWATGPLGRWAPGWGQPAGAAGANCQEGRGTQSQLWEAYLREKRSDRGRVNAGFRRKPGTETGKAIRGTDCFSVRAHWRGRRANFQDRASRQGAAMLPRLNSGGNPSGGKRAPPGEAELWKPSPAPGALGKPSYPKKSAW